jgi:hypothetical protein
VARFKASAYDHAIRNFVGKYHVSTNYDTVERDFIKKINRVFWEGLTATQRGALLQRLKKAHDANSDMYMFVRHGQQRRINRNPKLRKKAKARKFWEKRPATFPFMRLARTKRGRRFHKQVRLRDKRVAKFLKRSPGIKRKVWTPSLKLSKRITRLRGRLGRELKAPGFVNPGRKDRSFYENLLKRLTKSNIDGYFAMAAPVSGAKYFTSLGWFGKNDYVKALAEVKAARSRGKTAWVEPSFARFPIIPDADMSSIIPWRIMREKSMEIERAWKG